MKYKMYELLIPTELKMPVLLQDIDMAAVTAITSSFLSDISDCSERAFFELELITIDNDIKSIQKMIQSVLDKELLKTEAARQSWNNIFPYVLVCHRNISASQKEIDVFFCSHPTERPIHWLD